MAKKKVDDPGSLASASFNMTPMIDVTFQLIIVFLCSMKFRTLDQKIEAFLPKDVGMAATPTSAVEVETKVDVKLRRKPGETTTKILVLDNPIGNTSVAGIWTSLQGQLRGFGQKSEAGEKIKAQIDADPDVPHGEVMAALDSFQAVKLTNVVFRGTQLNKTGKLEAQPKKP